MKKKLGLLLAMLHEPKLLILDEPTNGLDVESTQLFYEIVRSEAARGTTILFPTHLMDHVARLCSHAVIINEGILIAAGPLGRTARALRRRLARRHLSPTDHPAGPSMIRHPAPPNPTAHWKTVALLLGTARKRALGRQKRQQELMRRRAKKPSMNLGGLATFGALALTLAIHGIAASICSRAVSAGQVLEAERSGRIGVDGWFKSDVKAARRTADDVVATGHQGLSLAMDDVSRDALSVFHGGRRSGWNASSELTSDNLAAARRAQTQADDDLERAYKTEADLLTRQDGGTSRAVEAQRRAAVQCHGDSDLVNEADVLHGLPGLGANRSLPAMLGSIVLLWWAVMLIFQGEGFELDLQRRRHPMWEWLYPLPSPPERSSPPRSDPPDGGRSSSFQAPWSRPGRPKLLELPDVAAILFGTYFLWILGPRSLASEGSALWLALTWPRGLESLLKAKAWLWSLISTGLAAMTLAYAVFLFPAGAWKVGLVGVGWLVFARSMAEKTVTLVTVTSSSVPSLSFNQYPLPKSLGSKDPTKTHPGFPMQPMLFKFAGKGEQDISRYPLYKKPDQ